MLSRVANSIYWTSRYIERAENIARFINANLQMSLDLPEGLYEQWQPLIDVTGDNDNFSQRYEVANQSNVIEFLTFDRNNPNSILSCLQIARENARSMRELITKEMWEHLNEFYLQLKSKSARELVEDNPYELFSQVINGSHLFHGITSSTLSYGDSWNFYVLGRMLERADKTSRILDVKYFILLPSVSYVGTTLDVIQWSSLLMSTSAFEMYLKRHGRLTSKNVIHFLLLDSKFPRALRFCAVRAEQALLNISGSPKGTYTNLAEQRLGLLCAELDYTNVDTIIRSGLHEYINELQIKLNNIDNGIFEAFFALK
jgi:uncharacterized alpha-E superfamily protein